MLFAAQLSEQAKIQDCNRFRESKSNVLKTQGRVFSGFLAVGVAITIEMRRPETM
jgi:hypothetical protein